MNNPISPELMDVLQDLSKSSFPYKRRTAAIKLGQAATSNEEIVQALATAATFDEDASVRSAALQAMQSPYHQEFLKDHPDFILKTTERVEQTQAEEKHNKEEEITAEYLRRRTRDRIYYLILFGGMVVSYILFVVGVTQEWLVLWMVRAWQVIFIAFVIVIFYLAYRNWRCPVCDSWLGGFTFTINSIWTPGSVRCPKCGTKLL